MMPNSYFQFKQFTIHQDQCAMKVCTDACLFGAWVARKMGSRPLTDDSKSDRRALDIGTGTGLLALMLAQKFDGTIDAIDIQPDAAQQASENAGNSPWSNHLHIHHADLTEWQAEAYDLILSNPPFYEHDLKSPDSQRNLALHDTGLTLLSLFENVIRLLKPNGKFALLLPAFRGKEAIDLARQWGLTATETMQVCQTEKHTAFRVMFWFEKSKTVGEEKNIRIKENGKYTEAFIELLKDYYLAF
jgi:tRNA1Val (adenine37-N6)-methyltransferase